MFAHVGSEKNKEWEGRSLQDMADAQGKRMVDTICDLLIEERLEVAFVARTGNPDNVRTIMAHPAQMVGSDGLMTGDMPNPRTYGTFPYVLGQAVEQGTLRLEDAVHKMTGAPARRLGTAGPRHPARRGEGGRGGVRPGARACAWPRSSHPKQLATGIEYVFVNGALVWEQGRHTGALPGRALRKG